MVRVKRLFKDVLKDFTIFVVLGNHDLYYVNSYDITALELISDLPNVTVVANGTQKFKILGKDWYIVPWIIEENNDKFVDWLGRMSARSDEEIANTVIFGHFELNGVCMEGNTYSKHGMEMSYLLKAARLTLSGHYHGKSYACEGDNELIYVGSPYQLTFVNSGAEHGYYTLDSELNYEFYENEISPKFVNIKDTDYDGRRLDNMFVNFYYNSSTPVLEFEAMKAKVEASGAITREFIPYTVKGEEIEADYSNYGGDEDDLTRRVDLRELTKVVIRMDNDPNRDLDSIFKKIDLVFRKFDHK
jgi:DNA repair exonuclease SbcCD nuclease subunit